MSMKKLIGCILKADKDYNLIEDNDYIGVGISGGKDSMALLYCLNIYKIVAKKILNKNFEIIGIHIDMNFTGMDFSEVNQFCEKHQIKIHHEKTKIYDILQKHPKKGNIQCSLCSPLKKGAVNKVAKQLGCNKVAFGHHADDAIETFFMNALYCGKIASFLPKMYLSNTDITFIRPFIYAYENEIINVVKSEKIPFVHSTCPNENITARADTKALLNDFYQKHPFAKQNFLHMLSNTDNVELWEKENNEKQE